MGVGSVSFSIRTAAAFVLLAMLAACSTLQGRTLETLNSQELQGTRWGLVVLSADSGRELVAIRPDERFTPASNTKLFTVAAALQRLPGLAIPDPAAGASVRIEPQEKGAPDIALIGGGDAMLIDAEDCERDCLSSLVNMVTASGVTRVRDVIGDDRLFPDQRWAEGWSHEDLIYRSGAPASALVINSNELVLQVAPGATAGEPVLTNWRTGDEYFQLTNQAVTVEGDKDQLRIERLPGLDVVRVYGTLGMGARAQTIPMAADDPARVAAWRLRRLLEQRGVVVEGQIRTRHRPPLLPGQSGGDSKTTVTETKGVEIGRLLPPPLIEDIRFLSKQSQNLHAEVLLRRLGLIEGEGSIADGLAVIRQMLSSFSVDEKAWDFSDGSGMSIYNRVTPRMVAQFLYRSTQEPWGAALREALPVGGVDGTLSRRYKGTPLEGRIFAKTGTLSGVNALSGFMLTSSGKMLIFSAYANDRPSGADSVVPALDAALNAIAAAY